MRTLALTIIAVALSFQLEGAEAQYSSYVKTNRYDFKVTEADMASTPVWKDQDDHPPLAARKALGLARARLAQLVSDSKDWKLDSLSLQPWGDGSHWYYLAVFTAPAPSDRVYIGRPVDMTIPVLMSGETVKPKVSAWP